MMGSRQAFTSFLHALFDPVQGFTIWSPATICPGAFRTVTLTVLRFLCVSRFDRTRLGFRLPACADAFQVGALLLEQLPERPFFSASMGVDAIL